ncbi:MULTISPECIES: hypothetical protein [Streptococcus]|nr:MULTISPECIES: hypothetical protein [Streptococcus]MBF0775987.1 hypothetical protein [Streptococcus sp. 19428wD3_AN2]MBF0788000.1 hypothetical protein [Streptococcus sp. 19428wC2_LYSM12]QBX22516.1 hypothetical protein Javan85_0019 [Streptococcus phage Javan85]QBX31918.1 hypothetical protein Javan84_0041 [Streptococcus phage Javan84]
MLRTKEDIAHELAVAYIVAKPEDTMWTHQQLAESYNKAYENILEHLK